PALAPPVRPPTLPTQVTAMQPRHDATRLLRFALALPLFAALPLLAAPPQPKVPPDHAEKIAHGQELFAKQVRGLLVEQRLKRPRGEKTRGALDLATREGLLKGGHSGEPAVVPFKAKDSRLYRLVAHLEKPHMPSREPKLSDKQIADL